MGFRDKHLHAEIEGRGKIEIGVKTEEEISNVAPGQKDSRERQSTISR